MEDPFRQVKKFPHLAVKNYWLLAGGVFLLIGIFFLIFWRNNNVDSLLKYAPQDSLFYVSFKHQLFSDNQKDFSHLPKSNWDQAINDLFNNQLDFFGNILSNSSQLSIIGLPVDDQPDWQAVVIVKTKDQTTKAALLNWPTHLLLNNQTILVASNSESLALIENIIGQAGNSLLSKNFVQYFSGSGIHLYFSHHFLNQYQGDDSTTNFFSQILVGDLFFKLKLKNDRWQITFTDLATGQKLIKQTIEQDFLPEQFLFFANQINLSQVWPDLLKLSSRLDDFTQNFDRSLNNVYHFVWSDIQSIFNQPIDLILFNKQDNFFGFDFAVISPVKNLEIDQFKKLVSLFLAQKSPTEIKRILPDQTTVRELVANPDNYAWQVKEVNGRTFYQISDSNLNFYLVYYQTQTNFYLASSFDGLSNLLTDRHFAIDDFLRPCGLSNQSQFLVINNQLGVLDYLPWQFNIFGFNGLGKMTGCLFN
ncbi:MAG: hypothetical protein JW816_01295 [Candidatus Buchananbacteria bacterium]|nr:hypothetical protein [Candidatus Buchananbacteria bacterium]